MKTRGVSIMGCFSDEIGGGRDEVYGEVWDR